MKREYLKWYEKSDKEIFCFPSKVKALENPVVRVVGSKSMANRALILAALSSGVSRLSNIPDCDDIRVMIDLLHVLGAHVKWTGANVVSVHGDWLSFGKLWRGQNGVEELSKKVMHVDVGESGVATRFGCALLTLFPGKFLVSGCCRVSKRPLSSLLHALRLLGASIVSQRNDELPVEIDGGKPLHFSLLEPDTQSSSQFVSALLIIAPCVFGGIGIHWKKRPVSMPYINLTLRMMIDFGICDLPLLFSGEENIVHVASGQYYQGVSDYQMEPDATLSAYFAAMVAIVGGEVILPGISRESMQGDVAFMEIFQDMGCHVEKKGDGICVKGRARKGIRVSMGDCPDIVPAVVAVALFVETETVIEGVEHLRNKESDRISTLIRELRKLGASIIFCAGSLHIVPQKMVVSKVCLDPAGDHRIAMALSLIALRIPGLTLMNASCVSKSFPGYWDEFARCLDF